MNIISPTNEPTNIYITPVDRKLESYQAEVNSIKNDTRFRGTQNYDRLIEIKAEIKTILQKGNLSPEIAAGYQTLLDDTSSALISETINFIIYLHGRPAEEKIELLNELSNSLTLDEKNKFQYLIDHAKNKVVLDNLAPVSTLPKPFGI